VSRTGQIELDIRGVLDDALGEHALRQEELDKLAPRVASLIQQIERDRSAGQSHAWRELPYDEAMVEQVQDVAGRIGRSARNLVVLGIGGSALGSIALNTALTPPLIDLLPHERRGIPRLFVMDNVDPVQFQALLDLLEGELAETVFNVVSKSGSTAETAAQFLVIHGLLRKRLGADRLADHLVITTDPEKGVLRRLVEREGYTSLPIPPPVGGRFSVLSAVGLYPACCRDIEIESLLAGAREMDERVRIPDLADNPAALIAAIHYLYDQPADSGRPRKPISVMMPYAYQLKDLADWFRQLWAESLGKRRNAHKTRDVWAGLTPVKALGATDQHSQIQLYREGPNDKVITFLEVEQFATDVPIPKGFANEPDLAYLGDKTLGRLLQAEKQGTQTALVASGRPCLTVRFPCVCAHTVGQFMYLYEAATAIAGGLFGINPYDQPGVELGKKITYHLMGRAGYEQMPTE